MAVLRWTLYALLSHWRRHPVQLASVLVGLWLATSLLTGVQALNGQARDSYQRASQWLGGSPQYWLSSPSGAVLPETLFVQLRRAGWPVSPQLQGRISLNGERLQLLGIEPLSLPRDQAVAGQRLDNAALLDFLRPPWVTWVAPDTLSSLGLREGQQPLSDTGQALPPLRVVPNMPPGTLLTDIGQAQRLLGMPGQLSRLWLDTAFAARAPTLPAGLDEQLRLQHGEAADDLGRLTESFHLNLNALGILAFVVGLFIVHAAIGLALEQRRGLLRNLRASGVSARSLIVALVLELLGMALLAGGAGVLSGYMLAALLLPDLTASLRGLYGAQVANQLHPGVLWWLGSLGMALLGALLAGASSLLRAARLPLLALARAQAWREAHARWLRRQGQVAVFGLGVALLASCGSGLASGFLMVTALLLGTALGLPVLLDRVLNILLAGRRSVLAQWFLADCRQQLPALSLALMALLLAMAASVGTGGMTAGFRQTFDGWLEQRLSAELYVTPADPAQARELQTWLQQQPTVSAVLPDWQVSLRLQGWPAELHGILDHPYYRQHWQLLAAMDGDPWQRLAEQQGIMLSEQLARRLGVGLGDRVEIPLPAGHWSPQVVGLYADYGNARGHLLASAIQLARHWPDLAPMRFNLRMAPEDIPALSQALQQRFGLDASRIIDQHQLKQWSTQVFERTFAATAALNALTLGVAAIALFISLLTQSQERIGQLAPLWALGVERRQLMWLNLGQTWLLAGLTLLVALPLGVLLTWCLNAVIQVQAFGWRLPTRLFPLQWLSLGALALGATLLASAWPLWRLRRSQPADLLRTFDREQ
ncbi:FtsX-like permease family protein [uncultured Pseudomonas sp.]|uniref:ABC transporter permease n=1 Tax=uncultured Pseudomonas sp. TaxID=114707 RepID=UPI0025CEF5D6|nr:FtsX-like permease family protein [uncultured Pseudomonas sp.]